MYKLIGPALLIQEQVEAKTKVEKRLELISSDLYVYVLVSRL